MDPISLKPDFVGNFVNCSRTTIRDPGVLSKLPRFPSQSRSSIPLAMDDHTRRLSWKDAHLEYLMTTLRFVVGAGAVAAVGSGAGAAILTGTVASALDFESSSTMREYMRNAIFMGGLSGPKGVPLDRSSFLWSLKASIQRIRLGKSGADKEIDRFLEALSPKNQSRATRQDSGTIASIISDSFRADPSLTILFNRSLQCGRSLSPDFSAHIRSSLKGSQGEKLLNIIERFESRAQIPAQSRPRQGDVLSRTPVGELLVWKSELKDITPDDILLCQDFLGSHYIPIAKKLAANSNCTRNTLASEMRIVSNAVVNQIKHIKEIVEHLAPRIRILKEFEKGAALAHRDIVAPYRDYLASFQLGRQQWESIGCYSRGQINLSEAKRRLDNATSIVGRSSRWREDSVVNSMLFFYRYEQMRQWIQTASRSNAPKVSKLKQFVSNAPSAGVRKLLQDLFP